MTRTLLVDGDIIVYKAAFAAEEVHQFDEDQWSTTADLGKAKSLIDSSLDRLREAALTATVVIALSDQAANWRKEIYPSYKLQRNKTRKPVLIKPLRDYLIATQNVFIRPTLEADDVLGILGTAQVIQGEKIIATIDKDLLQIPGQHLHIDSLKLSTVTVEEGDLRHLMQTLTGDVVDNYPGCPGVGPVKAAKILDTPESQWTAIVAAFTAKGLTEDDALTQARIARICRSTDYDFKARAVRLWTPG